MNSIYSLYLPSFFISKDVWGDGIYIPSEYGKLLVKKNHAKWRSSIINYNYIPILLKKLPYQRRVY